MTLFLLVLLFESAWWLLVVALHAVRLTPSGISEFELARRAKTGDKQAVFLQRREAALPDVRALKYVLETLAVVLLVAPGLVTFDLWLAVPLLVIALLFVEAATKWRFIAEHAQRFYETHEPGIITISERWHKVLKWLRGVQSRTPGQFVYSKEDLLEQLKASKGIVSKDELALIQHGLTFNDKKVSEVMTPCSVIDSLEAGETLGPVTLDRLHNSGHSRFPVYNRDVDHITGMLYLHDLVPLKKHFKHVRDAMHGIVFYINEGYSLERALAAFLHTRHHLLIVVNEYRETVGLLSLEDVMEALLGRRIVDEFDQHEDLRAVAGRNPRGNNAPSEGKDI